MPRKKKRGKKRGPKRLYNRLGKRIAALDERQSDIGRVLGICQQVVSRKLLGKTAVSVADLEKLAQYYKVPMTYFFEDWRP